MAASRLASVKNSATLCAMKRGGKKSLVRPVKWRARVRYAPHPKHITSFSGNYVSRRWVEALISAQVNALPRGFTRGHRAYEHRKETTLRRCGNCCSELATFLSAHQPYCCTAIVSGSRAVKTVDCGFYPETMGNERELISS